MRNGLLFALSVLFFTAGVAVGADHYDVLGVPRNAGPRAIDRAYAKLLEAHPEGVPSAVRQAYLTLSDPDRRAAYDRELRRRSLVRNWSVARQELREELTAEYRLAHADPAVARRGMLQMLEEELARAEAALFARESNEDPAFRAVYFFNHYRRNPLGRFPMVLELAIDRHGEFFAQEPTAAEVYRYLELLDREGAAVAGTAGGRGRWAMRSPERDEEKVRDVALAA